MAIRLTSLLEAREVALGYGVTVTLRPIGYADMKATELAAIRAARDRLQSERSALELTAQSGDAVRSDADIMGLAEQLMLDELVLRFASSWSGVFAADGETPAELTPENWRLFRQGVPYLADQLRAAIRMPAEMVVAEGKPSAP